MLHHAQLDLMDLQPSPINDKKNTSQINTIITTDESFEIIQLDVHVWLFETIAITFSPLVVSKVKLYRSVCKGRNHPSTRPSDPPQLGYQGETSSQPCSATIALPATSWTLHPNPHNDKHLSRSHYQYVQIHEHPALQVHELHLDHKFMTNESTWSRSAS